MTATQPDAGQPPRGEPSFTAMTAAAARAAHLIVDQAPFIFADTCAAAVLGDLADELIAYHRQHASHPVLSAARAQVIYRSRFAEDRLADAVATGMRQYVILGAGLDTFAYRSPLAAGLRVFEVDHRGTQAWKRSALAAARMGVPDALSFVEADLASGSLLSALAAAGFDVSQPAFISWLGVTVYLDRDAIGHTLGLLASCAPGTELIADYMLAPSLRDDAASGYADLVSSAAAERGEPWLSFFAPDEMTAMLGAQGFGAVRHVRQRDAVPADLWQRADSLQPIDLSVIALARLGSG